MNASDAAGPMTVVLAEGIYAIGETTLLKPERRSFSRMERLTIRSEVLPDDPGWHAGRMPTLVHTMPIPPTWNGRPDPLGGAANGFQVETSHVTIQGLKTLGIPVVETPKPGMKRRLYAVARLRRDLEDLEVAQCPFANNRKLAGTGTGARIEHADIDPSFLSMVGTMVTDRPISLEHDMTKRNWLHPVAGSEAAKIGAGLFVRPQE